jgi:hypothetical protein
VVISLISAIVGALGSQMFDFVKTRQLKLEEQRAAVEDRAWTENTEMYRQLYGMRGRLTGSLNRHHFAIIEKRYSAARATIMRTREPDPEAVEREKRVQDSIEQVLRDRAELELLLGWADLAAPAGDIRWPRAIEALVALKRWTPTVPPSTSLRDLDHWRSNETSRAQITRSTELKKKFAALLALVKEQRKYIRAAPAVSVRSP